MNQKDLARARKVLAGTWPESVPSRGWDDACCCGCCRSCCL